MRRQRRFTRRTMIWKLALGVSAIVVKQNLRAQENMASTQAGAPPDPRIRGPFLILTTAFTSSGEVDFEVLANEARFVDWCGCPGMIWPQSGDSVDLLTREEKLRGMEILADVAQTTKTALCLGVQGRDVEEMLIFAKHAEKLSPAAIISRPPDNGKTEDDLYAYWRTLAKVAGRPVIIQTTGGVAYRGPTPSVELLTTLAREFPLFGYVKEEAPPVPTRIRALVKSRPPIRRVFSARGGLGWLYESRLGAEGLITERAVYADVLVRIWEMLQSGSDAETLRDAYAKFLLMANLGDNIPGGSLRGAHLYVWKKRGVFKTLVSRHYGPNNAIPKQPLFSELKLTEEEIAEIESRYEALRPYLKPGTPHFGPSQETS